MTDRFAKFTQTLDAPSSDAFAITPADATVFSQPTRAIYVGTTGNLKVMMAGRVANTVITFTNIPDGSLLPIRVQRVYSANTTATGLIGLY
jgi:hypothetical protein